MDLLLFRAWSLVVEWLGSGWGRGNDVGWLDWVGLDSDGWTLTILFVILARLDNLAN